MTTHNSEHRLRGSFSDDWESHKDDILWRRFWALWELRRKWKWADWFYKRLDRINGIIVETSAWTHLPGENYMKLCLWIAFLRSVHEGLIEKLDSFNTPKGQCVSVSRVFKSIPASISSFPSVKGSPFRDFRNAIFHCQWTPLMAKFELDENITTKLTDLHKNLGDYLDSHFRDCYNEFKKYYSVPNNWIFNGYGKESFPELFY